MAFIVVFVLHECKTCICECIKICILCAFVLLSDCVYVWQIQIGPCKSAWKKIGVHHCQLKRHALWIEIYWLKCIVYGWYGMASYRIVSHGIPKRACLWLFSNGHDECKHCKTTNLTSMYLWYFCVILNFLAYSIFFGKYIL